MREKIQPAGEIIYPDRGGYTGFSICFWDVGEKPVNSFSAVTAWGGFHLDRLLPGISFVSGGYFLEGRFFVFGSLPFLVIETGNKDKIRTVSESLFGIWKPIMDEITKIEKDMWEDMWKNESRHGVHVDEVLTPDILHKINSTPYANKRKSE